MIKLNFQLGNAKLKKDTCIFSIPAGHTCKFAKDCRSCADKVTGKIKDGPDTKFRCYATGAECLFPNIRKSRWDNFELLKQAKTAIGMAKLIEDALLTKKNIKLVRFHQSGDFWSQSYFDAWLMVAQQHPEWIFYGYSKALTYWVKRLSLIPSNFKIVASRGGTHDYLIDIFGLRSVRVVFSEREAKRKWHLELDHDDTHCWKGNKDFAVLLHGQQPKNSIAAKKWYHIMHFGQGGYKSDYFGHYSKTQRRENEKLLREKSKSIIIPIVSVSPKHSAKVLNHA
jgi:hypothetical protein